MVRELYNGHSSGIHSLVDSYYPNVIAQYQAQRTDFLKSLKNNTIATEKEFVDRLNSSIKTDLENGEIASSFDEVFEEIKEDLNLVLAKRIIGEESDDLKKLREIFNEKAKKYNVENISKNSLKKYYNSMQKSIERYLESNNIDRQYILKILEKNQLTPDAANKETVLNAFYGYTRRTIFKFLQDGEIGNNLGYNTINYKKSLRGYYKEDLLKGAFDILLSGTELSAHGVGAMPGKKGHETEIDILISKISGSNPAEVLNEIQEKINQFSGIEGKVSSDMGEPTTIGVQSKSWIEPWAEGTWGNRSFLMVGHRNDLLNSLAPTGLYSWHLGILFGAQYLQEIIGVNNILFSTGTGIQWTADLISNFRKSNYYLAFYISKKTHEATGEVVWEQES